MDNIKTYDPEKAKVFIIERFLKREDISSLINIDITNAVNQAVDADEEFREIVDTNHQSYSNDDEIEFIKGKTGFDYKFIDLLLWQIYCYEMELGLWEFNIYSCLDCGRDKLYLKEVIGVDFAEKIVCQDCGCEMIDGKNGLERIKPQLKRIK